MASEVQIESSQPRGGADYVTKTVYLIDNFQDAKLAYCLHKITIKHIFKRSFAAGHSHDISLSINVKTCIPCM